MVVKGAYPQESKGGEDALASLLFGDPAVLRADTKSREAKARSGNAAHVAICRAVHSRTVEHQTGVRIPMIPEVLERPVT